MFVLDSCSGPNKNFLCICLWQLLILNGTFNMITHKFPIVGHSFNDSDRDGGKVENILKTKKTKKQKKILMGTLIAYVMLRRRTNFKYVEWTDASMICHKQ